MSQVATGKNLHVGKSHPKSSPQGKKLGKADAQVNATAHSIFGEQDKVNDEDVAQTQESSGLPVKQGLKKGKGKVNKDKRASAKPVTDPKQIKKVGGMGLNELFSEEDRAAMARG